nr:acyltransferase family protein [Novosphingobium flavum]
MRFCAATAVVAEHARDFLFLTFAEAQAPGAGWKLFYFITGFGREAVMVFFVISGFWITSAIDRRRKGPSFWSDYLIDRLSRLLLVIVPALLIGGLFDLISLRLHSPYAEGLSGALSLTASIQPRMEPQVLLGNLLFLQNIAVPTFGSNGPLWSLANEFWYYLWFPALLLALIQRRPNLALATIAIGLLAPLSLYGGFGVWLMGSALYYLDRMAMAGAFRSRIAAASGPGRLAWLGAAACLLAATASASRLDRLHDFADPAVGLAFALFLWVVLRLDPRRRPAMAAFAGYGAKASFSLYATHFPLVVLLATLLTAGQRGAPDAKTVAMLVLVLAVVLAAGWLFSLLTEQRTAQVRARARTLFLIRSQA